jgi:hypothetical protein
MASGWDALPGVDLMRNAYRETGRRFDFPITERNCFIDFWMSSDPYPLG